MTGTPCDDGPTQLSQSRCGCRDAASSSSSSVGGAARPPTRPAAAAAAAAATRTTSRLTVELRHASTSGPSAASTLGTSTWKARQPNAPSVKATACSGKRHVVAPAAAFSRAACSMRAAASRAKRSTTAPRPPAAAPPTSPANAACRRKAGDAPHPSDSAKAAALWRTSGRGTGRGRLRFAERSGALVTKMGTVAGLRQAPLPSASKPSERNSPAACCPGPPGRPSGMCSDAAHTAARISTSMNTLLRRLSTMSWRQ